MKKGRKWERSKKVEFGVRVKQKRKRKKCVKAECSKIKNKTFKMDD